MIELFGQNGWKNVKEGNRIIFTKKLKPDTNSVVEVVVYINTNSAYIMYGDSKYEVEKEEYGEILNLAEEIHYRKKQVVELAKRYKKKHFLNVMK